MGTGKSCPEDVGYTVARRPSGTSRPRASPVCGTQASIGVIMRGYANYKARGGEIKLCGLGKRLQQLFVMMKLIMVFDHHDSEEQAIAAFAEGPAPTT